MSSSSNGHGRGSAKEGRGVTATPADDLTHAERTKQVVQLRLAGATFAQIADALGYTNRSGPYKVWQQAMSAIPRTVADEARRLEEARLDAMLRAIWPAVLAGKYGAIDRALNISRRRARMLGLDAPMQVRGILTDALDDEVKRLVDAMNMLPPADLDAANGRETAAPE